MMISLFNKTWGCCLAAALFMFVQMPLEAGAGNVVVNYTPRMSLRELAGRHLDHPDRWELILRYNGFSRLSDLSPGVSLEIPVTEYRELNQKLKDTRTFCTEAALNGAKILSPRFLEQAWTHERDARSLMNRGELKRALETAEKAVSFAHSALKVAREKRTRTVSAVLYRKQGTLQSRRQTRRTWKDAEIGQEFVEKEYVRTLKESRGEIYFINDQHVDLKENSLVVIGKIRKDLLEKTTAAHVKIMKGDMLVYLDSLSQKERFSVELPGVEAKIRSRHFRTGRDREQTARIANYDGEIDVSAAGKSVTLLKNEGTRILHRQPPAPPVSLLPPPRITRPEMDGVQDSLRLEIVWEAVDEARSYQVEISENPAFYPLLHTASTTSASLVWNAPENGIYYLRALSIDSQGLAGPFSTPHTIYVNTDVSELFLAVHSPADGAVFYSGQATVQGVVAAGAAVSINGTDIPVAPDGKFVHQIPLKEAENEIRILARKSGKKEVSLARRVFYRPSEHLMKIDAGGTIYSRQSNVMLSGTIAPQTRVEINGRPVSITGNFTYLLDLPEGDHLIRIKAEQEPDRVQEISVQAHVDLTPPRLTLNPGPAYVTEATGTLAGNVSAEAVLFLNGEPVNVSAGGDFSVSVPLDEGRNDFRLRAEDPAGNQTQITRTLWRDNRPPVIGHIEVAPERIQSGGIVMVKIRATDEGAGLARTGQFTLLIAEKNFRGILTLDKNGRRYQGSLFVPPDVSGPVVVSRLELQDLLGNRKTAAYDAATGKLSELPSP